METKLYGEIAPGGKWAVPLLLLALAIYVPGLWTYPLSDSESKYAEIPREMVESGDWVQPQLDYVPYLTKPPLSFWITAAWYKLGGVNEFGARLPNAILALALAFVLGAIARTLFGTRASTIAVVLALTTAEFYVYTRECGVEMALVFFMALVHHCFLRWQRTEKRTWVILAWASAAGAVLTKGPMGILFPGLSILLYLLITKQRGQLRRLFHPAGILVFLALALPWPIAMAFHNPDFLWFAFVHETWYRVLGERLPNDALYPTGYFLALVAAEFYPWIQHLPHAVARGVREGRISYDGHCIVYVLCWALVPLVVFSVSASKVDFYGLQSYPGFLLLVAWLWDKRIAGGEHAPSKLLLSSTFLISAVLAAGALYYVHTSPVEARELVGTEVPVWMVDVFLKVAFAGNLFAGVLLLADRPRTALLSIAVTMIVFFAIVQVQFAQLTPSDSMNFATQPYRAAMGPRTILVCDEQREFAHLAVLPFYVNLGDRPPRQSCYMLRDGNGSRLRFHDRNPQKACVIDEVDLVRWVEEGKDVFLVGDQEQTGQRLGRLGFVADRVGTAKDRAVYRIRRK